MSSLAHWLYAFLFSPEGGGWGYPYLGLPGIDALTVIVILVPLSIFAVELATRHIDRRQWPALAGLLVFGVAAQLTLRWLAPTNLSQVIESAGANGFLDVARAHGPIEFLARFHTLVGELPMHVRANLPGKTLLFHLLLAVTNSAAVMGGLIVAASTAGGAMVYFLAREWFGDRRIALSAAVLYAFVPARIFFLPVLNVLTPLFLLAPMCLLEWHFTSRRAWPPLAAGVALYALMIFEPLPLAAGLIVVAQMTRRVRLGHVGWWNVAIAAALPAMTLVLAHLAMRALTGFDTVAAFFTALEDARHFNAVNARPHGLWAFHNIKDFFLQMGAAQGLLFAFALWTSHRDRTWLTWSLAAVLAALTLFGVNRGETVRLWIFLGVFLQIVAAHVCGSRPWLFKAVMACAIVQTAILASSVGWITVGAN